MRKNKMLRMASALLILVLLTTSVVGGTFAKYTTSADTSDTARVAKWGVTITVDNDSSIFKSSYTKDDKSFTDASITNSVEAAVSGGAQDKVVAPGTTGSTTFKIAGTPEVAVKLSFEVEASNTVKVEKNTDVTMDAGKFESAAVKVQPSADYEPITFEIAKKADGASSWEPLKVDNSGKISDSGTDASGLTLAGLETALESLSKKYPANTKLDAEYKITWTWPIETTFNSWNNGTGYKSDYSNADILDTYLGNQTNAQKEKYEITFTATQID